MSVKACPEVATAGPESYTDRTADYGELAVDLREGVRERVDLPFRLLFVGFLSEMAERLPTGLTTRERGYFQNVGANGLVFSYRTKSLIGSASFLLTSTVLHDTLSVRGEVAPVPALPGG
ncbi:MAG: hypothetical protein OXF02_04075 [Simkaniaceae bacterium]|nr:hypothetical protein [Simkaniaceae bacterium]